MLLTKYLEPDEFNVSRNPNLYYNFLEITNSISEKQEAKIKDFQKEILKNINLLESKSASLQEAARSFMQESKMSLKVNTNRFTDLETLDENINRYQGENLNYIVVMSDTVRLILNSFEDLHKFSKKLMPPHVLTDEKNKETFNGRLVEIQLNGALLEGYINQIATLYLNSDAASKFALQLLMLQEKYFQMLVQRHTVDGVKIYKDPIITDIAIRIFQNVDSHGEIDSGKDKISAYTLRKAEILAESLKDPLVNSFISSPTTLINFIKSSLQDLDNIFNSLSALFDSQISSLLMMGMNQNNSKMKLSNTLKMFEELNPSNITYIDSNKMITENEKMQIKIQDETVENIVAKLLDPNINYQEVISYILDRKVELKQFYHEENSFYICKIGGGNSFQGEAPGALEVIPAEKPKGDIKWILGEGYSEVREFAESIKSSSKFHSLFLATSPSKTADKSNILLIGPPGCGKTEVMRAIASSKDSIAIFAQGSDFLTCWKGEAEKNPKRLFEEGLKLSRESGKHVHFLIDEIDSVLNNDKGHGDINLTLEFQILMDGVVRYPNLSVWGATNHPERIPMPMMRRFNKALIVGELSFEDRTRLLRHYMNFLPLTDIKEEKWEEWAYELEGATGDVIRKISDYLWREKMNWFVTSKPKQADEMLALLHASGDFSLDNFDREKFNQELSKHVVITSNDIQRSIDSCLSNVSIKHEIETAVETYKASKILLNQLQD